MGRGTGKKGSREAATAGAISDELLSGGFPERKDEEREIAPHIQTEGVRRSGCKGKAHFMASEQ
jgi:hypothetical protein